jgi:hypothetical protein
MATIVTDTRAGNEVPLRAIKGETWQVEFDVTDSLSQPIDLSNADITLIGKHKATDDDSTAPFIATKTDGLTVSGDGSYKVRNNKIMTLSKKDNYFKLVVVLNGQTLLPYFGALTVDII